MPETAIGFFPDVGGSFFLSRLDGSLGAYLGLTGHRLKGEEVLLAGIATHYVPSARLNSLLNRLSELDTEEIDVINAAIEEFVGDPSLKTWQNWRLGGEVGQAVDRCFSKGTLEEIVEALEKEGTEWSRETLDTLKKMSPTSLKVSLRQIQIGRRKTFAECFQLERWLAKRLLEIKTDFHEGVKAKLVEKREPAWLPSWDDKGNITPALLDSFFFDEKKMRADKDHPELSNRTTFYEYPHRTLSGLPTRMDITNVVYGNADIS
ncbi:hypothetical protein HK097_000060 [Rhizophlyctis rosea]|uniref:3-hydroxyisobutyryl-CoA hydrolase n=1 Tax=Rhizophlyctis rosea TaxID=64517 RepID=A0AAD5SLF9_9FUNG|nr:hypothetical protein HK097_000060 [Rhizophlyctis rosea]